MSRLNYIGNALLEAADKIKYFLCHESAEIDLSKETKQRIRKTTQELEIMRERLYSIDLLISGDISEKEFKKEDAEINKKDFELV